MITASLDNHSETAELYPQGTERYVRNPQFHFTQQTRENRTTVVASSPETTVLLEGPEAEFIAEVDGKTLEDMMRLPRWAADLPLMFALAAQLQYRGLIMTETQLSDHTTQGNIEIIDVTRARVLKSFSASPQDGIRVIDGHTVPSVNSGLPTVIVCEDMISPAAEKLSRKYEAAGHLYCLVQLQGADALISPVLGTSSSVPYDQLKHSLQVNAQYALSGGKLLDNVMGAASVTPRSVVRSLVWSAIQRMKTSDPAENTVLRFKNGLFEGEHYVMTGAKTTKAQPLNLDVQAKKIDLSFNPVNDAGRAKSTRETWETYRHLVSDVTGVVSSLKRLVPEDEELLVHVYGAGHNWALNHGSSEEFTRSLRGRSSGKGTTDLGARVSGLAEAIERHSAISDGTEARLHTSYKDLGEQALDPRTLTQFSQDQYEQRDVLNQVKDPYHWVPEKFDPTAEIDWMPVWRPACDETAWIPAAYSLFMFDHGAMLPGAKCPLGQKMMRSDSNGLASGSTPGDAAAQALLELIERDAVAIWWYNEIPRQIMAPEFTDTPFIQRTREWLQSIGRNLEILDITTDIGIPVAAAVAPKPGDASDQIILGFGAHPNPEIAATRAVTEALQFMCALPAQFRTAEGMDLDLLKISVDDAASHWLQNAKLADNPHLVPDPQALNVEHVPWKQADPQRIIARLEDVGLPVYLQELTRPYIGLPVVRALVPGLRPWWRRLATGRLYDVPVQCGWLAQPIQETDLNPISMFF